MFLVLSTIALLGSLAVITYEAIVSRAEKRVKKPILVTSRRPRSKKMAATLAGSSAESPESSVPEPQESAQTPPKRQKRASKGGLELTRGFSAGRAEELFGAENQEREDGEPETPFGELSEMEQLKIMDTIASLAAEQRDVVRSLAGHGQRSEPKQEISEKEAHFQALRVNGIIIRVPATQPSENATPARRVKAVQAQEKRLQDIKETLYVLGGRSGTREAYEQRVSELYVRLHVSRDARQLEEKAALLDAEISLATEQGKNSPTGYPVGVDLEVIKTMRLEKDGLREKMKLLATAESFGPLVQRVTQLQDYADQVHSGMLIQVPTVQRARDTMLENLYAHRHFVVYGHTGGGKTELARQVAQQYMLEQGIGVDMNKLAQMPESERARALATIPVEVLSASEETSVYDLIAKTKLAPGEAPDPETLAQSAQSLSDTLKRQKIEIPPEKIAELLLGKGNITRTIAQYGPVARALKKGTPVIIDEINLMRPEARGALNYLLTAKIGDPIVFPQNGEETFVMPPGFVVIATENRGAEYAGIQRAGAAQKSRLAELEMPYPELPELFDIVLSSLLRKDRASLPPDFPPEDYHKLAMLALVAHEVQTLFAGNTQAQMFMTRTAGGSAVPRKSQFQHFVLSPRVLIRDVIEQWMGGGFSQSLDDIIANKMVTKASGESGNNDEQKLLVEKLILRGFFKGWNVERFAQAGVKAVSQEELDALQVAITQGDSAVGDAFAEQAKDALSRANVVEGAMLVGNRSRNTAAMAQQGT